MQQQWSAVDEYLVNSLIPDDPIFTKILANNSAAGLPAIDVAPNQGQFLQLLVQITQATRILEIGTLGAYSSVWMARALPADGKLVTLEASPHHAEIAKKNIQLAGLETVIELHLGPAVETLPKLAGSAPFDLIFIDADKPSNPIYLEWALKYSRPGTLIIGDNVVRNGGVTNPESNDPGIKGTRTFIELMGNNPRLTATALQTVGSKGWDGFSIARVKE
ncbi:O-methyltransferase [Buttiauxella sp. WJP83]|uniref:O-methyltransferase n=1 Tax=Buttiauxella sp. WJP83 TaxID=2986951 RepID=UPI0022DDA461|nr:O-methyltransferase [Buttiauxella sp. WJP83]WBM68779.1 O-methyltransferase [Buttiauxella sp. WJP83]